MHQNSLFSKQKFWGGQTPLSVGSGHPLPTPYPLAPTALDLVPAAFDLGLWERPRFFLGPLQALYIMTTMLKL